MLYKLLAALTMTAAFAGVRAIEAGLIWVGYNLLAPMCHLPHMTATAAFGAALLMCEIRSPFSKAPESTQQVAFYRAVRPALPALDN